MKNVWPFFILIIIVSFACNRKPSEAAIEEWKQEIVNTEKAFSEMAGERSIREAFLHFAAEDAVLMRNNSLVIGKTAMEDIFAGQAAAPDNELLSWEPEFVDVALSGDLGYTYGYYTYSFTDSIGTQVESEGVFHTVWKRQADGTWRFVWD